MTQVIEIAHGVLTAGFMKTEFLEKVFSNMLPKRKLLKFTKDGIPVFGYESLTNTYPNEYDFINTFYNKDYMGAKEYFKLEFRLK